METDFIPITNESFSKSKARRHGNATADKGGDDDEAEPRKRIALLTDISAPWLQYEVIDTRNTPPLVRFHNEILSFCEYVSPTKAELLKRKSLYEEIKEIALALWPECSVRVFGSQLSNILTPTSDLDITILNVPTNTVQNALFQLSDVFKSPNMVTFIEVVANAKVNCDRPN